MALVIGCLLAPTCSLTRPANSLVLAALIEKIWSTYMGAFGLRQERRPQAYTQSTHKKPAHW